MALPSGPAQTQEPPSPGAGARPPTASVPGFSAFQNPATNKGRVCGASEWAWKLLNVRMHGVERRGRSEEAEAELGKRRGAGRQGARASLELGGAGCREPGCSRGSGRREMRSAWPQRETGAHVESIEHALSARGAPGSPKDVTEQEALSPGLTRARSRV